MNTVQRAVGAALVALIAFAGAMLLENSYVADPELRYPILLLTGILGAIITFILVVRVALAFIRGRVRNVAPQAEASLRPLGTFTIVTAFSAMGLVFGISLMVSQSGATQFWPLGIVLAFGGLGAYSTSHLWWAWKMYRRFKDKQ